MSDGLDCLILDLVEWVAKEPRPYAQVLEAWRTSCPRLPVWEDACERGFVTRRPVAGRGVLVVATETGRRFLRSAGRTDGGADGPDGRTLNASPHAR